MIRVEALHFSFPASLLFSGLDFRVTSGEVLSIIGPNGCGKSTLLRLLRGNLTPQKGKILWNGTPVVSLSRQNMARRVSVVPQSVHTDFPYRVDEMVAMGRYPHRRSLLSFSTRADRQAIRHALAITDIAHLQTRPVTQLSGGELQRVFIARALAQSTEVLFLDEATSHLDIDHRLDISELLVRLNKDQGTTIVQVSHDLDMAAAMSDRILLLNEQGEKISSGKPAEVMTAANLHRVFRVNVRVGTNPLTGTPVILPLMNTSAHQLDHLKVHLFCGGGSGSAVLRKLHLAGAEVTVGPLNQGDADETLAAALNLPMSKRRLSAPIPAMRSTVPRKSSTVAIPWLLQPCGGERVICPALILRPRRCADRKPSIWSTSSKIRIIPQAGRGNGSNACSRQGRLPSTTPKSFCDDWLSSRRMRTQIPENRYPACVSPPRRRAPETVL